MAEELKNVSLIDS
jgi:hypothetical protein